jgi:predicted DNA-binding transcriptional regulator AlpA
MTTAPRGSEAGHSKKRKQLRSRQLNQKVMQVRPRLLNVEETAKYLGIAPKTLRNRIGPRAEHPFPVKPKRIGKRVLFEMKALDAYIDSLPSA